MLFTRNDPNNVYGYKAVEALAGVLLYFIPKRFNAFAAVRLD